MPVAEVAISNLLYLYAELMDAGDLDGAAALFRHADILVGDSDTPIDFRALRETWGRYVLLHPCGTPRTKHVVTNPIIEIDEVAGAATCRSYYTVLQACGDFALQPIAAGRYHDRFERIDGIWRFSFRDYRMLDLVGALGQHLRLPVSG